MPTEAVKVNEHSQSEKRPSSLPASAAKIAFFGTFGIQNLGNECTLQAIVHNAHKRFGGQKFCAVSFNPVDTLARHNLDAFPMSHFTKAQPSRMPRIFRILFRRIPGELMEWLRAVKGLRGVQLVVMTGTGMLTDYSTTAFGFPYHVFRWALAARLAGCKLRFVSVGVGPIYDSLSRRFIRWALQLADYRSFRDEFSKSRIETVFDSSKDYVFPDLAFSLPMEMFPRNSDRLHKHKIREVGLGIMDHRDIHLFNRIQQQTSYSAYLDKMCEFVEWLIGQKYRVRILQGDAKHDAAPRLELRSRLERRGVHYETSGIFDEGSSTVGELLEQLSQVDVVVSPRFHNLLLGMMMSIPAISISYDPKNDALLDGIGLSRYHQDLFKLDVKVLVDQLLDVQERSDEVVSMINRKSHEYRLLLEKQYDMVFEGL